MVPDRKQNRILVLTHHYRPETNFITADVAERLAERAEVIVVTCHPNYPKGKFFPGTRYWRPERRTEGKVTVWRLPFYPDHSLSAARRALSYLSSAVMAAIFAPFVARCADTVWIYQGPFTTALAAVWFKLVHGSRIVLTSADLWPESMLATGVAGKGRLMDLMFVYRRAINRMADLIICCTRGTQKRYEEDGIPASKMCYVPVWVDGVDDYQAPLDVTGRNLVYAGNIGPAQRLDTLVRAAAQLKSEGTCVGVDVYGSGGAEKSLRDLASELGATNVKFHGRVSPEDAFRASSEALAQVVSLQPSPMFRMTVPSKLSMAFAAAAPILYGLEGEAAELAEESGGGVRFDADNVGSLVSAIRRLLDMSDEQRCEMRHNLRHYYEERFAPERLLDRYAELLAPVPQPVTVAAQLQPTLETKAS